jgi:DNA-directed RNA polymerase subunit H (RpoH/RPB5)
MNKQNVVCSIHTIYEMLIDRGVNLTVPRDVLVEIAIAHHFKTIFDIVVDNIKIMYYMPVKFKLPELKGAFTETDKNYEYIILVCKEKISLNNLKSLNELKLNLQFFDIKELQFNISKHVLVPHHEIIKDEEIIKDLVQKYSVKNKHQFPHILKSDPMSKYLGLKSGDMVKITRISPTAGEYIMYRCCV